MAKLIVISGPSGVGKDAILKILKDIDATSHFAITATTRPQRINEQNGIDYIFMDSKKFKDLIKEGNFLEYAEVYGEIYGVPKSQVLEPIREGKNVIVKTDIQGALTLKSKILDSLLIFIAPPDLNQLEKRLKNRQSETGINLKQRLETADLEMKSQDKFDHVVINYTDLIEDAAYAVEKIIRESK